MNANLIRLDTAKFKKQAASFQQNDKYRATIMNRISDEIWIRIRNGNLDQLIAATELSKQTLMNIAHGNTQWPRPNTLFTLLNVFRLKLKIVEE